jgi:DNA-binding NarL/FixJ family response regulator
MRSRRPAPAVRVLIADDHRLVAEALAAMLETEQQLEVVGLAYDGQEAVQLAQTLEPDVVLLDISLPVLDGFEAATRILEPSAPPAVVMLTGSNAAQDVDRARRVGARGYVTKDSIAAQLVDAILEAARPR